FETNFLLSNLTVKKIMARNPVTITTGTTVEEAACIMIDQDISWLPVTEGGKLVGIVSKTDLLKMFVETIGARVHGTTINFIVQDKAGMMAAVTEKITAQAMNLITCSVFNSTETNNKIITIKVSGSVRNQLVDIVKPFAVQILDVTEN
ncbi:MAG: CBS domain-containing protein, partial [Spirochaetales bacterium]|nr:CBS domain-containing protein [Candidatus Physcosoma equi]